MSESLLRVDALRAGYGDAVVLDNVGFEMKQGEALAVLGRNGVGKTTLMATLMGLTRLRQGTIALAGRAIEQQRPFERARAGLGWVPQERDIFASLTVAENLTATARKGPWTLQRVYTLFPRLEERRRNMGNQLSGGEQQMLAIARALLVNPRLLLLDEPMEGLAPVIVEELADSIRKMNRADGLAMIVVEQHAELALSLTGRVICLERGRIAHEGSSSALLADRDLLGRLVSVHSSHARTPSYD
jgi:branched-chain amino acid transport system ATP-binding protein